MTSVADAQALILASTTLGRTETIVLAQAYQRILASPLCATSDSPPFDRSAMDGYALGPQGAQTDRYRLRGEIVTGTEPSTVLGTGEAVRIFTGGAVPAGAVRVIPQECVEASPSEITVREWPSSTMIRRKGEDHRAGEVLWAGREKIGPAELGLLAAEGIDQPTVFSRPRVAHVVTGNELTAPEETPEPGQIRDSNTDLIAGLIAHAGGKRVFHDRVGDDPSTLRAVLAQAEHVGIDFLLISGGASVGAHDGTRAALEAIGYRVLLHQVRVRPGRPILFAQRGPMLAFGLPGNPVSQAACFELFVKPALYARQGRVVPGLRTGRLAHDWTPSPEPREVYWPGRATARGAETILTPARWKSSGHLSALAGCNAWIRIPEKAGPWRAGEGIEYRDPND